MTKTKTPTSLSFEVEALCAVMQKYGVTELKAGDICIVRPPFAVLPKDEKPAGQEEADEFERIRRASPDQQDRALQLGGLGPLGSG